MLKIIKKIFIYGIISIKLQSIEVINYIQSNNSYYYIKKLNA